MAKVAHAKVAIISGVGSEQGMAHRHRELVDKSACFIPGYPNSHCLQAPFPKGLFP